MQHLRLLVLHVDECDRKKCTALKLARFGYVTVLEFRPSFPPGILTLDPFAPTILSPQDAPLAERKGILALDCSWNATDPGSFRRHLRGRRTEGRALPYLLAANPTKYAQPFKLSTLEALAAAVFILGGRDVAGQLLSVYSWGPNFLELNAEPLREYADATSEAQVRKIQGEYLEDK